MSAPQRLPLSPGYRGEGENLDFQRHCTSAWRLVWRGPLFNALSQAAAGSVLAFSLSTMFIAVPTGVKILNWLATLYGGRLRFTTAMLFSMGLVGMFTIGGLSA